MKKMKITFAIIILVFAYNFVSAQGNAGGTLIPTTSVYAGDMTTEMFQKKLDVIDVEISKYETKKQAELKLLQTSYEDNMPKAPKTKKTVTEKKETVKETKTKKAKYSLVEDLNPTTEVKKDTVSSSSTVVEKVEDNTDAANFTQVKATYDAKYEASKDAIIAKYDALIAQYEAQRLKLTDAMVNSKGNYVASTTSADKAANLYMTMKYADNMNNGSVGTSTSVNPQGVVMLYVENKSTTYSITMTSAPFTGITLTPGQKSTIAMPVQVGIYAMAYTEYRNGTNFSKNRNMNVPIAPGTTGKSITITNRQ